MKEQTKLRIFAAAVIIVILGASYLIATDGKEVPAITRYRGMR